jgi:purine-binding chemotaxis protein CheW
MTDAYTVSDGKAVAEGQQELVDFKMVTFTLGGKDYGVDIMRVKEIAKFYHFTYVPNTAHFVRGVYNLRGDIISIIDLRSFFNLPVHEQAEGEPENGLILRLENNMLGIVVDSIDKVVGISSRQVQPPHPIFGDINVKYISGVAEYDERLYIILDVDRIFTREEETDENQPSIQDRIDKHRPETGSDGSGTASPPATPHQENAKQSDDTEVQRRFLADGLQAFSSYYVTPANHGWFSRRVDEWVAERRANGSEYQLKEPADAEAFLRPFFSRFTGAFWREAYLEAFQSQLHATEATVYQVWNPGCGSGHESYSIAASLRVRFPEKQIKIWAGDKDL